MPCILQHPKSFWRVPAGMQRPFCPVLDQSETHEGSQTQSVLISGCERSGLGRNSNSDLMEMSGARGTLGQALEGIFLVSRMFMGFF